MGSMKCVRVKHRFGACSGRWHWVQGKNTCEAEISHDIFARESFLLIRAGLAT